MEHQILKNYFEFHILVSFTDGKFGITTGDSFFKPILPAKTDMDDWVVLLKSWIESEKAVAVRWPSEDDSSSSWNQFEYSHEALDKNRNDDTQQKNILKCGIVLFYSESIEEMRQERDRLILEANNNDKKYLQSKNGKQKFDYPTSYPPNYVSQDKRVKKTKKIKTKYPNVESTGDKAAEKNSHRKKNAGLNKSMTPPVSESEQHYYKPTESSHRAVGKKNPSVRKKDMCDNQATANIVVCRNVDDDSGMSSPDKSLEASQYSISGADVSRNTTNIDDSSNSKNSRSSAEDYYTAQNMLADGNSSSEYHKKIDKLEKVNQLLKEKVESIETEMTDYYNQLASKEAQNLELIDRISELEKEQPVVLVKEMKDVVAELKSLFITFRDRPNHGQQLQQSSASNTSSSSKSTLVNQACNGTRMKKLWGRVFISESCERKISITLRTDKDTEMGRNRIVSLILEDLFTVEELANMSLSGRRCPGLVGAVAKPKMSEDIVSAIKNYMQKKWDDNFTVRDEKGNVLFLAVLTDKHVNSAIGAKLISCHIAIKSKNQKKQKAERRGKAISGDSEGDANNPTTIADAAGDDDAATSNAEEEDNIED